MDRLQLWRVDGGDERETKREAQRVDGVDIFLMAMVIMDDSCGAKYDD